MSEQVKTRKKLIEVALPLEAINASSAREKSIRHGHPSTLHLWWARRPLAAARAVIFSQMVADPSSVPELFPTEEAQEQERQRLFKLIEELVKWENTTNELVLNQAREEIWKSWRRACEDNKDHPRAKELFNPEKLPAFHDPFAGGGALPLEAQRLGLEAYASDLNPVAVLINKAMIEIPPKFAGMPPVNPESRKDKRLLEKRWHGAEGLAEDVRYYGKWMRDEAEKRIGHLYPKVEITTEMTKDRPDLKPLIGQKLTVIAWLWARTVKSPNPAFADVDVPLASTFMLSTKPGKEAYVEPVITKDGYAFAVKLGKPHAEDTAKNGTKLARGANFKCVMSGSPISGDYIKAEGRAGRMSSRIMAVVVEGKSGRIYLPANSRSDEISGGATPNWKPETQLAPDPRALWTPAYGLTTFGDLFNNRQLVALNTFCDMLREAQKGTTVDASTLVEDQSSATEYGNAVTVYLGLAIGRAADAWSSLVSWRNGVEATRGTFARQGLPMVWDFAEANPFSDSCGNWMGACLEWVARAISALPASRQGKASQLDAAVQALSTAKLVSTDPPYYDNIGYADLSDFFYVWLRRCLKNVVPDLFSTLAVPKGEELVAIPYRHGGKAEAEEFFLRGMTAAMHRLADQSHPGFPVTIYYAFKQSENETDEGTASTGWETFLDAVIRAGFAISGTWPIRTERPGKITANTNILASSIILNCHTRPAAAPLATRREFMNALKTELPIALLHLQRGNIAPVDLAQAAIGPGMAIYTRYSKVVDAEGKSLGVREALALINQTLDEVLAEQEGDFDSDTRWALAWFEQSGFAEGEYGIAETLSKAKNTSISGLENAGILKSKAGKVRLLRPDELSSSWDPVSDSRLTVWEAVHHLIRRLEHGGEAPASELASVLGGIAETARELAYRLYTICERKKRAQEALSYNALVQSWPEISRLAREGGKAHEQQATMFTS